MREPPPNSPEPTTIAVCTAHKKMTSGNQFQPGRWPIGLASPGGFRWGRLLTGLFAGAVSLATTWRPGTMPGELARAAAPASQHRPAAASAPVITAALAGRLEPEFVKITATPEGAPPAAAAAATGETTTQGTEGALTRQSASPTNARLGASPRAVALGANRVLHVKPGAGPGAIDYDPIARTQLRRKRSDVRNEYLASREEVAAFSGEDSGSAYLARQAARQAARQGDAPMNRSAHPHNPRHASRS